MDRMSCNRRSRGLTLIELMITLVILVITVSVVSPAMQQLIHGNRLRVETDRLLLAINLARSEAINRNSPVSLCPSAMADSGEPVCSGAYTDGWIVFTNPDGDPVVDAPAEEVIRAFEPVPRGYSVTNAAGTRAAGELITYRPDGSSRRSLTLLLCPPPGAQLAPWGVVLNNVGRPRRLRGDIGGTGTCPAGAS